MLSLVGGCNSMKPSHLLLILSILTPASVAAGDTGESLTQMLCASCHTVSGKPTLAPPVFAVIKHVKRKHPDRDGFVQRIIDWVNEPNIDQALMPCATKKFGVMPTLNYNEQDVRTIAEYWYDGDIGPAGKHRKQQGKGTGKCQY